MTVDLSQEDMDVISSNSPYKRAINNLELRSDMGIEFSYPIREMLFAHVDTIASNGSTSEIALKCALNGGMGMLVNYKDDSTFAGEIVFGKDDIFENEIIYNADSPPQFTPFEQGNYINRTSLTITEGIEAQLLDFGFAPETTLALALRLSDDEYGICFHDDEKAAYYNNVTKHGKSLDQKLYSFEELRDALCEVYDVCSIEEIDALYASTVESESDGINIGQTVANPVTAKPVIYLYPERETEVSVKLGYPAEYLTYTYPEYNGGWQVIAYPDGRMINKSDGSEHYYLFWEGDKKIDWDMSKVKQSWLYTSAKRNGIPICRIAGRNYYSKKHIDEFFGVAVDISQITQWLTAEQVEELFNMKPTALRAYTYRHKIPTKREYGRTYYSQSHLAELRRTDLMSDENYFTVEQVQQIYGLTSANICHIVKVKHIGKVKVGRKNLLLRADVERVMAERNEQP